MIEKITPRKLNTSKDARIQGAIEMYDAYNVSINDFTDASGDSALSSDSGTISGSNTGDQGVIKPAKGNKKLTNSLTVTDAAASTTGKKRRIIGSVTDEVNGKIYCFLTSELGTEHGVYAIDGDDLVPVFTSGHFQFAGNDHNGFIKADIVYLKSGPVIYFTDGENEPRKLHINEASSFSSIPTYDTTAAQRTVDFITACPKRPMHRPSFVFDSDPDSATNFRGVQGFQFAYQCIYDTGEETALSPYSNVAVPPSYLNQGALSEPALQSDNVIKVTVPHTFNGVTNFTENISKIRLLVRVGGIGSFFEVEEKDYNKTAADALGGVKFSFYNDSIVTAIPQEDMDKIDEGVPKKAKTQAVVNDRLMYGNYTEGFDEKDSIDCSLSVFYNDRQEEFTDLEISVKKLILPVGYDYGVNFEYNSDLSSFLGTDNSGNELVHNRRAAYQFDLSSLPSNIPANTEVRLKLSIRPDKNFELYDSKNSFHTFKNVGYTPGQDQLDSKSINSTTRRIKDYAGNDSDMPAVAQFNEGVLLDDMTWTIAPADAPNGSFGGQSGIPYPVSTGHSPSCPFIIPSTSITFALALKFNETIDGEATVKSNISNAIRNFFKNGNLTDESGGFYPVDDTIQVVSSASDAFPESDIDQGLDGGSGFGELESNDPVLQTIMQLFYRENIFNNANFSSAQNHLPKDEIRALGFAALNKARITSTLDFQGEAVGAVNGTDNDIGPIFSLGFSELTGFGGTGKPEYTTMIPNMTPSGDFKWSWASPDYMASIGTAQGPTDANQFFGDDYDLVVRNPTDDPQVDIDLTTKENLYFVLSNPLPIGTLTGNYFGGQLYTSTTNFFREGADTEQVNQDFKNQALEGVAANYDYFVNEIPSNRLTNLGYVTVNSGGGLAIVSSVSDFSGNNGYQKYSIVDGEVNVRRSNIGGESHNFWYGFLHGTEYIGKQNNMFSLSRGWRGGGGYPGPFHGLFSYGNSSYSESDGFIDSNLSEADEQLILDDAFPEIEIRTFSYAQFSTGQSIDPQSRSFKRYCNHDFGVVFYDERGRAGNVNPIGSVYVNGYEFSPATGSAFVVASFDNQIANIPSWAHSYRMVYGGNTTIDDFVQYSAGGAFVPAASKNNDGLIYVSLNYLQENNLVSYSKAYGAVRADGDKDLYTYSDGDRLRIISYYNDEDTRVFVNTAEHNFEVVGTVTLGENDNPLVGENEDVHPAKTGQFVILKDNFLAQGFSFDDVLASRSVNAGLDTSDIYDATNNRWNRRCVFEIYTPTKSQASEDKVYYEIGKTYNIIKSSGQRRYQTPTVIMTEGDVFFRKVAVNLPSFVGGTFKGLIGNGNGESEESIEPNFKSYYLESNTFTDRFPGADVKPFGKPRIISREKKEVVRPSSIKFSDKNNAQSNIVRYTSFNDSKLPFKDLQNNDGPITSLVNFNDSLFCIQQLKCSSIPVSRTIFNDALGAETVLGSSKVLGTEKYYAGSFGSSHPESVVRVDSTVYFASSDFKEVYRFNPNQGIEVISGKGMGSFFNRALTLDADKNFRVVGGYDPESDEFLLSISDDVSSFAVSTFYDYNQPSGSVVLDSTEGFTGTEGFIGGGGFSDGDAEAIVNILFNLESALELEQTTLQNILNSIGDLEGLLTEDFSAAASGGFSQTFNIGGLDPITIGPFSNASSYNAALGEIQATALQSVATGVGSILGQLESIEQAYDISISTTAVAVTRLLDQLQILQLLAPQIAQLTDNDGTVPLNDILDPIYADSNIPFGSGGLSLSEYITQTSVAQSEITLLKEAWDSTLPEIVTAENILASDFELLNVEIPAEILSLDQVSIKHTVDVPDTPNLPFSEAIESATQSYQNLIAIIGELDISTVVSDVFQYIVTNVIGADDDLIVGLQNQISTLQQELYGADEAQGGTGADAGIYENYQALLQYAFGPDGTPIDDVTLGSGTTLAGNGALDGGIDQDRRDALTLAENLQDDVDDLFVEYAKYYIDLFGNNAPGMTFTQSNGNELNTDTVNYITSAATFYGEAEGVGLYEAILNAISGVVDEEIVTQLKVIIANRKQFMDEVIEDFVGVDLSGIEQALSEGELTADENFIQEGTNEGLVIRINAALERVQERIPPAGLLSSIVTKVYPFIENNTLDNQNLPGGIDGLLGMEGIASANPFEASEAIALQALEQDLQTIINYSQNQVDGDNNNASIFSIVNIAQWLNAHRQLIGVNATDFNTIGVSPQTTFGFDLEGFIDQVITIPEGNTTVIEGDIQNFQDLVGPGGFLRSGQLSANQVRELLNGYKNRVVGVEGGGLEEIGINNFQFADITGDNAVSTADLLDFLAQFGQQNVFPTHGFRGSPLGDGSFPDE